MMNNAAVRQRADLTHRHNTDRGRHGWLRLTPAYSLKLVRHILGQYEKRITVLDPFSGTGTTPLVATSLGHGATGIDVNPFLVWFGKVKLARYTNADLTEAQHVLETLLGILKDGAVIPVPPPPLHNIERWWHEDVLHFLCVLKAGIDETTRRRSRVRNILHVAFCRAMISLSNASFNHQSMSFANHIADEQHSRDVCIQVFRQSAEFILSTLKPNPKGKGKILLGDSTDIDSLVSEDFDLLLTSPPYPNRMSYIRELRPYMYWLQYLQHAREAGELDWRAIGGTWGIATSRLGEWSPEDNGLQLAYLERIVDDIAHSGGKNAALLANYVHKYFCDIWKHVLAAKQVMKPGGKVVYIVGNSTFYDILVPVEQIYADLLKSVGFCSVHVETIRKRNSKKALYEFAVEGANDSSESRTRLPKSSALLIASISRDNR